MVGSPRSVLVRPDWVIGGFCSRSRASWPKLGARLWFAERAFSPNSCCSRELCHTLRRKNENSRRRRSGCRRARELREANHLRAVPPPLAHLGPRHKVRAYPGSPGKHAAVLTVL